jgi:hypothetical protein
MKRGALKTPLRRRTDLKVKTGNSAKKYEMNGTLNF